MNCNLPSYFLPSCTTILDHSDSILAYEAYLASKERQKMDTGFSNILTIYYHYPEAVEPFFQCSSRLVARPTAY